MSILLHPALRIEDDIYKWKCKYIDHKERFKNAVSANRHKIELVEIKTKLNRGVIGQILVGEYLFKKKFNANKVIKAILYHIGDEALEEYCKDNNIKLIKF
jgi:hypothetical protein